jgi:hypothetical protein
LKTNKNEEKLLKEIFDWDYLAKEKLHKILEKTVKEKIALVRNTLADSILEQVAEHLGDDHTEEEIWQICEDLVNKVELKINHNK